VDRASRLLSTWRRLSRTATGRWLFSRLVCWKAPYFRTIRPQFELLEPGRCELTIGKRRAVLNHIGTVHAIAICNMAELAAGSATDVTIPVSHRWIPKGMTVEYQRKATTGLRAIASLKIDDLGAGTEVPVTVSVTDQNGEQVVAAVIRMWITRRRET
jgi:acyl-coenzyme A thioesterase PaaI-like protein